MVLTHYRTWQAAIFEGETERTFWALGSCVGHRTLEVQAHAVADHTSSSRQWRECRHPSPTTVSIITTITNMAISETNGQGWRAIPNPVKEGQRYINLNSGHLFVQQPPKRERDREAHLNYCDSIYNRMIQLSHCKTKLNQIPQKQAWILD